MRHPLDTCFSIYMQPFWPDLHPYSFSLSSTAEFYRYYWQIMALWRELDYEFIDAPYELLVTDQERSSKKLCGYLGLNCSKEMLNFHQSEHIISTASRHQVNEKMYRKAIGRWRHYKEHLDEVREALKDIIEEYEHFVPQSRI